MFLTEKMSLEFSCQPWLWLTLLEVFQIKGVSSTVCKKNKALPEEAEGNTYLCNDPDKRACCEVEEEFTCCVPEVVRNLLEQFQLWAIVTALVLLIGILMFCLLKDVNYCAIETPLKHKIQACCRRKNNKLTDLNKTSVEDDESPGCSRSQDSASTTDTSSRPSNTVKVLRPKH
ncbi:uncharacterized protein LOC121380364 [Gigantopelta aegis]|uniref:uncharacterized protein LOC121380364 n=1 Tax=Gigantopelta aegis TaxID=1735272 RepID=UPI001B889510|nr:uncharacterized protein LOC121380364 [Gigantopelta aegis]